MRWYKQLTILLFAAVIFTGSVGISEFAHFCKVDGVDYSYVLPVKHACKEDVAEKDTCCKAPVKVKENQEQAKSDCCKDEVKSYKISSDIFQKSAPELIKVYLPSPTPAYVVLAAIPLETGNGNQPYTQRPPPKSGQEILIQNQVFRI